VTGPSSGLLSEQVRALTRRLDELEKIAGRVEALECRVGVAPRLPRFEGRDALGQRDVTGAGHVHTLGPHGVSPTEGY
jgi:hypothetical protein